MFVPIGDDNPLKAIRFQYVTIALIAANVLVFLLELARGGSESAFVASFALVPRELIQAGMTGGVVVPYAQDAVLVPERLTLLTYMFFHGDAMHLLGNMLFLWVFGDNVEDALGHARFLAFYLICGVAAGLLHTLVLSGSQDALIGASGAVSGVISAYLMLHPRVRVWVLAFKIFPLRISAAVVLGLWILFQFLMLVAPAAPNEPVSTAWWAHVGGLIAGAVLVPFMRRPGVPLFGR